jgi:prepilin-type processing-associated H-X9-DG protein
MPPSFNISAANQFAVQQVVKLFLCPADKGQPVSVAYGEPVIGPTNYAVCVGSGLPPGGNGPLGSPLNSDGMFMAAPGFNGFKITDVTDGSSNTAMMSESLLGDGPESASGPMPGDPQLVYAYTGFGTRVSDAACAAAAQWNVSNRRGFMWASGEMRCGSYNHYYTPNPPLPDCICNDGATFTSMGFRAARSRHTGGVNVLLGDGSVHFISNAVSLTTWRALATRAGGEVPGSY